MRRFFGPEDSLPTGRSLLNLQGMAFSKSVRRRLYILTAALGLPALLLVMTEAVLRLAGYGFEARYYYRDHSLEGTAVARANPQFSRVYFPDKLKRLPPGFELTLDKAPGAYRIFVLGESAAMGDPYTDFSLARMLERMLTQAHPELKIEVVNAAVTGINSHVMRHIAADVAELEPDFFAIYAGNNEVIGPYGSGTIFHAGLESDTLIHAGIALRRWCLGQALDALLRPRMQPGVPAAWGGPAMFQEQPRAWGDPRLERTYKQFQANLRSVIREGRSAGASVALATMAVNLRDQPPFISVDDTPGLRELMERYEFSPDSVPWEELQASRAAHPLHAGLCFTLAREHLRRGELSEARALFREACERDALRLRADSRLDAGMRAVAADESVPLLDFAAELAAQSPHGIPGDESFWEHVHLRPEATYRLASLFYQAVEQDLLRRGRIAQASATPTWEQIVESLPITRHDDLMLGDLLTERFSKPPFAALPGNDLRLNAARSLRQGALADLRRKAVQQDIDRQFAAALNHAPADPVLQLSHGLYLITTRRFEPARQALLRARERLPNDPDVLFKLARASAQLNLHEEAAETLRDLGAITPDYPKRRMHLTEALVALKQYPEALTVLGEQLAQQPDDLGSRLARAQVYWQSKDTTAARADLQSVEDSDPASAPIWVQVASVWFRMGEVDKGRAALNRAARINPADPTLMQFLLRHNAKTQPSTPAALSPGTP